MKILFNQLKFLSKCSNRVTVNIRRVNRVTKVRFRVKPIVIGLPGPTEISGIGYTGGMPNIWP